ncbi:MAG TPA: hypothetical protein VGJ74_23465 [Burkholderiales bacterium]|jgi:DNA-binding NarL/FixJ family response regulator
MSTRDSPAVSLVVLTVVDHPLIRSALREVVGLMFDKLGVSNRTQAAIAARALVKSKPPGH